MIDNDSSTDIMKAQRRKKADTSEYYIFYEVGELMEK